MPLQHTDPIWLGRFTSEEVRALLPRWPSGARRPPIEGKDLAFAGLSMLGLGRPGGGWREPHLRDRLQAIRALTFLDGGDIRPLVRARAESVGRLARWGLAGAEPDGRG